MSSTILYKFRSGTTFEALPLPGSAARVFDVKKAIVAAKKLNGSIDFELSIRNATTNEEYVDETMLLPRGTRIIVHRLAAGKGHGFLARMARNQYGGVQGMVSQGNMGISAQSAVAIGGAGVAPSGFYTIDSRTIDEDEEFVHTGGASNIDAEDKELAALKAVTDTANTAVSGGGLRPTPGAFSRPGGHSQHPPGGPAASGAVSRPGAYPSKQKQNADPELRDQEKKLMPKKLTGIPRTFLKLSAPPPTEFGKGENGEATENNGSMPLLQPNTVGFEELVNRAGGQSENAAGTKKDLDYALKVTATSIPEYLQCGICSGVVNNAMLLPWDPEGRTACETCIRDALTQNGFRCPLTDIEGVSPDDLHPNVGLRKAAELFITGVMEKMEEIEKHAVDNDDTDAGDALTDSKAGNILEGVSGEKGVILTKKAVLSTRKKKEEDDPFGGDDDFGGDVFAVEAERTEEDGSGDIDDTDKDDQVPKATNDKLPSLVEKATMGQNLDPSSPGGNDDQNVEKNKSQSSPAEHASTEEKQSEKEGHANYRSDATNIPNSPKVEYDHGNHRRETNRRRGPPAGYAMGPAGGSATAVGDDHNRDDRSTDGGNFHSYGTRGGRGRSMIGGRGNAGYNSQYQDRQGFRGRGRGRGRFGGRFQQRGEWDGGYGGRDGGKYNDRVSHDPYSHDGNQYSHDGNDSRANKRPRHNSEDHDSTGYEYGDDRAGVDYQYHGKAGGPDYGGWNRGRNQNTRGNYRGGYGNGRYDHGGGDPYRTMDGYRGGYRGRGGYYGKGRF